MSSQNRILAVSHLLLRFSLVLALFFMLTFPHLGMTAETETPTISMHPTANVQGQMSHSGGMQIALNGAFCAMLCAGLAGAEGTADSARFVILTFARWSSDAAPVWATIQPDPAQRPPDTTPGA